MLAVAGVRGAMGEDTTALRFDSTPELGVSSRSVSDSRRAVA